MGTTCFVRPGESEATLLFKKAAGRGEYRQVAGANAESLSGETAYCNFAQARLDCVKAECWRNPLVD
jgi:hypothetical protein